MHDLINNAESNRIVTLRLFDATEEISQFFKQDFSFLQAELLKHTEQIVNFSSRNESCNAFPTIQNHSP